MTRDELIELGKLLRSAITRDGHITNRAEERLFSLFERFRGDDIMQARVLMEFSNKADLAPGGLDPSLKLA